MWLVALTPVLRGACKLHAYEEQAVNVSIATSVVNDMALYPVSSMTTDALIALAREIVALQITQSGRASNTRYLVALRSRDPTSQ